MKRIGILENNYAVYWKSKGHFRVEFQYDGHTISLSEFECYPRLSEETLAFSAFLILDGVRVGDCSNEGRGGCASYHAYEHWDLARKVSDAVAEVENYCFPKTKLNLYDVIDTLANYYNVFQAEKSCNTAKNAIDELNAYADKLRIKYAN